MESKCQGGKAGKLIGAVDAIFQRRSSSSDERNSLEADLAAFGVDPSSLPDYLLEDNEEDYVVWEEHENVVSLFLRVCRQWRTAGETILGIDLSVVPVVTNLIGIELTMELLDELQTMEARAVEILNKPAKKNKTRRLR